MPVRSGYLFNCSLYFSIICLPVIYSTKKGVSLSLTVTMNFSTSSLRSINLLRVLLGSSIRYRYLGFPGGAVIKNICQCRYWQNACQCRRLRKCGFNLWAAESCWGRKWWPSPVFLPGQSHGQRSLADSPWGRKELDMTKQLSAQYT